MGKKYRNKLEYIPLYTAADLKAYEALTVKFDKSLKELIEQTRETEEYRIELELENKKREHEKLAYTLTREKDEPCGLFSREAEETIGEPRTAVEDAVRMVRNLQTPGSAESALGSPPSKERRR